MFNILTILFQFESHSCIKKSQPKIQALVIQSFSLVLILSIARSNTLRATETEKLITPLILVLSQRFLPNSSQFSFVASYKLCQNKIFDHYYTEIHKRQKNKLTMSQVLVICHLKEKKTIPILLVQFFDNLYRKKLLCFVVAVFILFILKSGSELNSGICL